jgi:hypothetical protein
MTSTNLRKDLYNVATRGVRFSLKLPNNQFTGWLIDRFFGGFFTGVIDAAVTFDEMIAEKSLKEACGWISSICGTAPQVHGVENLPGDGPLLLVSNHPGYFEGMLTISFLQRDDFRLVVSGVPYFNQLPNASKYIFYTDHSEGENVNALRKAVAHLRDGGTFMIYPTGQADPDPDAMPGSSERLDDWSESVALMLRRVPETRLVPIIVSGIVNPRFLRHPLALIQRERRPRIRVAELFQMYQQFGKSDRPPLSNPRISFGPAISGTELIEQVGRRNIMSEVIRRARVELDLHMARKGAG